MAGKVCLSEYVLVVCDNGSGNEVHWFRDLVGDCSIQLSAFAVFISRHTRIYPLLHYVGTTGKWYSTTDNCTLFCNAI